jgi:hypothetical protein
MRSQAVLFTAVLIIALLDRLKHRFAVFALLAFPSTLAHEIMHFVVALIFGGKPSAMQLWPKRQSNNYALGHVVVRNSTRFNIGPIAIAPLLLIPLAWYLLRYVPTKPSWWQVLLWGAVIGSLLYGSLPSGADWRLAWKAPANTITLGLLLLCLLWFFYAPNAAKRLGLHAFTSIYQPSKYLSEALTPSLFNRHTVKRDGLRAQ